VARTSAGTLQSVNVGLPKDVLWQGRTVHTGVFKEPVAGPRRVGRLNVEGDGQGDLAGHGGEQRAVFVYQLDSYRYWERELDRHDFVPGQFGENFTVEGMNDDEVCIGDRYRIGTALLEVTQPRVTCYRVGLRMNDPRIPALLVSHHRPGFYFRVLEEGDVQAGDPIIKTASGPEQMTVAEMDALLYLPGHPRQQLLRALRIPALSPGWQASLQALLESRPGSGNAGLTVTSPPPAWPGFRPLTVTDITSESESVISVRLEQSAPLPAARPGQYLTVRVQTDSDSRSLLRSYSMSGPPGVGYYRIAVKREHDGAVSGYLHSRLAVGDRLDVAAPRGTFILDDGPAPVLLVSAGIGVTPVLSMLHVLAAEDSARDVWWLHGARNGREHAFAAEAAALLASLPNARSRRYFSSPERATGRAATSTTSVVSPEQCSPSSHHPAMRRPTSADRRPSWRTSAPAWPPSASRPRTSTPSRSGQRPASRRASLRHRPGLPTHPAGCPAPGRASSSPAATSPWPGAASTPACSSSPRPAISPSAGPAGPACAEPARRRSSPASSTTARSRSSRPPRAAACSVAPSPAAT
jgi:MOSC domain-containing protein YiiM/ferredoxin-NADP reductase